MEDRKKFQAVTHDGYFHCDEVMGTAILFLYYPNIEIIRTRDSEKIKNADIVYDVGGIFHDSEHRYDHHMTDPPINKYGEKYSSAGLLWREFGKKLCHIDGDEQGTNHIHSSVYQDLIRHIDNVDNGEYEQTDPTSFVMSLPYIIDTFNPNWTDNIEEDKAFNTAVNFAKQVLLKCIEKKKAIYACSTYLQSVHEKTDNSILILDKNCPWQDCIDEHLPEFIDVYDYVIFPVSDQDETSWFIQAMHVHGNPFKSKKPFPKEWAGKRNQDFVDVSGVDDVIFCHPARFIAGGNTKESVLSLALTI